MKKPLIVLAVIALLIGCTKWQNPQFIPVWKTIEAKPEVARVILSKINKDALTESGIAEYGLLKTIVDYKTHVAIDNDSLISASITYYNQHGSKWYRGRAYFYRGVVRMYRFGNIVDAVRDFKVAEYISEKTDDEELKTHVYDYLAQVNHYFRNYPTILRYSHKLLDISTERKDSAMMLKNLIMCATAHADMDQMDSAYIYIKKGIELEKHANMDQLSDIYSMMAEIYAEQGETSKAQAYLDKWKQTDSNNTKWYLIPAYIRKAQGEYDMAIRLAELGLSSGDQNVRRKCLVLLSELYDLKGEKEKANETRLLIGSYDDMKYTNQAMMMVDWQQNIDEQRLTKDFYRQTTWMQRLIFGIVLIVVLAVAAGMWWHRRKVSRLSSQLDEDARKTSELNTKVGLLENRMEHISNTLLIGTQMYNQLQQRQSIAEATAKEQQSLVDYFAQLRPKRWQEWNRKYKNLSTAQYVFLIMQDDLHYDDEAIATVLDVKRTSVRSMRSRIKNREK